MQGGTGHRAQGSGLRAKSEGHRASICDNLLPRIQDAEKQTSSKVPEIHSSRAKDPREEEMIGFE